MTNKISTEFIKRIQSVEESDTPKFGKMTVNQMITHCADLFRMMFGEIEGIERQNVDIKELRAQAERGETVQTPKGLDQVAGGGTKPGDFEEDKKILINYLNRFNDTDDNYKFSFHALFGDIPRDNWERLVVYHLNHHLSQFGR